MSITTSRIASLVGRKSRAELEEENAQLRERLDTVAGERVVQAQRAEYFERRFREADRFIRYDLPAEVANPWARICQARRDGHAHREENLALRAQVADLQRALAGRQPIAIGPGDRAATDRHAQPSPDLADTQPIARPVRLGTAVWIGAQHPDAASKERTAS